LCCAKPAKAFGGGAVGCTFHRGGCNVPFEDSVNEFSERDNAMALSLCEETDNAMALSLSEHADNRDAVMAFSPKWWAMVAMQVALDPKVSDEAFRVYTVVAAYKPQGSNVVSVGQRLVARRLRKSQPYVSKYIQELVRAGWIGVQEASDGKRAVYVLLAEAYGASAAKADGVTESVAPGVQCARCHKDTKAIPASGICRKCLREMEEERMLRAAREKLGADATLEQLALECHIQRITPRIRKILRRMERAA
jgi:DNA-binding MarR family transcriptional regulator